ncbi:MAG: hypothetical protein JRH20_16515 [Deltaproteobacteria bacterium]|nr:hypothetical protein [Deltaproteobacteria bacterium]
MMEREQARSHFSDYLDEDLSDELRLAFEQALEADDELREEFHSFRMTVKSLSSLRLTAPPPEFARKVERRIQRRSHGRFFRDQRLLMRLPFEWFSFIIILLLLVLYMTLMLDIKRVEKAGKKPPGVEKKLKKAPTSAPTSSPSSRPTAQTP